MAESLLGEQPAGLYLHIPFCLHKCAYCDFISYVGLESSWQPYLGGIYRELELRLPSWEHIKFDTLYIGGGTPTILPVLWLSGMVKSVLARVSHTNTIEVTVEANPGTITAEYLGELLTAGVNRLSIGVQSLQPAELGVLERVHSPEQAVHAFRAARTAGFSNINLDLMYGLPGQTLDLWCKSMERVLDLRPEHLALYALTLDTQTPMAQNIERGAFALPVDELFADMYDLAVGLCQEDGYEHYEISNWALQSGAERGSVTSPRFASQHNLHYWRNERYLGLGAGAFSYDGARRWGNIPQVGSYLQSVNAGAPPEVESETLTNRDALGETIMLNLRLIDGLRWDDLSRRFQVDARTVYHKQIAALCAQGLLEVDDMGMRLSRRALFIANQVFSEFV
jgi:oxygen-independent coproporphyrinogen III oxidase